MTDTNTPGTHVDVTWCNNCGEAVDGVTIYECSRCSTRSDERRCPDDNIFMARTEDPGCPNCFAELEDKTMVIDHDGELVDESDFLADGEAFSVRDKAARSAKTAALAQERADQLAALADGSAETTWNAVVPGQRLLPNPERSYSIPATISHVALSADGESVYVVSKDHGLRFASHPANEVVRVLPATETPAPYGLWTLLDGAPESASGAGRTVEIEIEQGWEENGFVTHLALLSVRGGHQSYLATWADPALAAQGLDVLEQAAMRLHALRGTIPAAVLAPVPVNDNGAPATSRVPESVTVQVGFDSWDSRGAGIIDVVANRDSTAVGDPDSLLAAVQTARDLLSRLTLIPAQVIA